jgi:hypothetical protein
MMNQSALASAAAGPSATRDAIDFAPPRDFGSESLPGGQGYIDAKNSFISKGGKRTRRRRRSKKVKRFSFPPKITDVLHNGTRTQYR